MDRGKKLWVSPTRMTSSRHRLRKHTSKVGLGHAPRETRAATMPPPASAEAYSLVNPPRVADLLARHKDDVAFLLEEGRK